MAAVLVDSSVWIDHLRGSTTREAQILRQLLERLYPESGVADPTDILVADLVLLEVLRGITNDSQFIRTRAVLLGFSQVDLGGRRIALAAADHYRRLRGRGITVRKSVDCLIAAWCIWHDVPLLHRDRDFEPFMDHGGLRTL